MQTHDKESAPNITVVTNWLHMDDEAISIVIQGYCKLQPSVEYDSEQGEKLPKNKKLSWIKKWGKTTTAKKAHR